MTLAVKGLMMIMMGIKTVVLLCSSIQKNLPPADPLTKGLLLSWDTLARYGMVFNCKHAVIRGHLPNTDSG